MYICVGKSVAVAVAIVVAPVRLRHPLVSRSAIKTARQRTACLNDIRSGRPADNRLDTDLAGPASTTASRQARPSCPDLPKRSPSKIR